MQVIRIQAQGTVRKRQLCMPPQNILYSTNTASMRMYEAKHYIPSIDNELQHIIAAPFDVGKFRRIGQLRGEMRRLNCVQTFWPQLIKSVRYGSTATTHVLRHGIQPWRSVLSSYLDSLMGNLVLLELPGAFLARYFVFQDSEAKLPFIGSGVAADKVGSTSLRISPAT